ncbi:MAG: hypothetical protein V4708_11365 [Bacteroidota bacterium]
MKKIIPIFAAVLLLIGCDKNEAPKNLKEFNTLHNQFHGKYNIVSSSSNIPIDVNLDGKVSTDLIEEILALKRSFVEIRVRLNDDTDGSYNVLLSVLWPEQTVSYNGGLLPLETVSTYNSSFNVNYDLKGISLKCDSKIDSNIRFEPGQNKYSTKYYLSTPSTIKVDKTSRIVVTTNRTVYSSSGLKEVKIITIYQKISNKL